MLAHLLQLLLLLLLGQLLLPLQLLLLLVKPTNDILALRECRKGVGVLLFDLSFLLGGMASSAQSRLVFLNLGLGRG